MTTSPVHRQARRLKWRRRVNCARSTIWNGTPAENTRFNHNNHDVYWNYLQSEIDRIAKIASEE